MIQLLPIALWRQLLTRLVPGVDFAGLRCCCTVVLLILFHTVEFCVQTFISVIIVAYKRVPAEKDWLRRNVFLLIALRQKDGMVLQQLSARRSFRVSRIVFVVIRRGVDCLLTLF